MEAWSIALLAVAGLIVVAFLLASKGRATQLPEKPLHQAWSAGAPWAQLYSTPDVRILFNARHSLGQGVPVLCLCPADDRGRSLSLSWSEGIPNLTIEPRRASVLFGAAPAGFAHPDRADSADPAFDSQVSVGGNPLVVAAVLDHATRRCLIRLFDESFAVDAAGVVALVSTLPARQILKACPELVTLARAVSPQRSPEERKSALVCNVRGDPVPEVRARNLQVLLEHFPSDPIVISVTREALESPEPHLRLAAATLAPASFDLSARHEVLVELARGSHPAQLRVKAIDALCTAPEPLPDLRRELYALLRDENELVRSAVFGHLEARGWQPEGGTLALAPSEGGELSLSAHRAPTGASDPKE